MVHGPPRRQRHDVRPRSTRWPWARTRERVSTTAGRLYGVGVGPGRSRAGDGQGGSADRGRRRRRLPLRAARALQRAGDRERVPAATQVEEALIYPVTTEDRPPGGYQGAIDDFYTEAAARLAAHLDAGRDVVVLAEGDPFFYGSYMHMHKRLAHRYEAEVVPGVTSGERRGGGARDARWWSATRS